MIILRFGLAYADGDPGPGRAVERASVGASALRRRAA